jgi:membrane protein DedA with SNARE-associated domain
LPSEVVAPFCGYAAARGELNIVGVIGAAVLGSMVGQLPWYYAGRLLGEKRIEALAARYGRWLTVTPHEVQRVFGWFARFGAASVFFGRMIPAVRAVISLPAGIAEMPLGKFLLYSLAGTTIWMGGLAYAGYRLGQNYQLVAKYIEPGTKIVVALIVLLYVARLVLSFRKPQPK